MTNQVVHNFRCSICGNRRFVGELNETLREAKCNNCRATKRNSDVALAILRQFNLDENSTLRKELRKLKNIKIYEAGSSGALHDTLKAVHNYVCSEYYADLNSGQINPVSKTRCENLEELSFPANTFDLVITQDVLEHVANPKIAFKEIDRVLKPSGCHIFTVPIHESRKTVTRVKSTKSGNINLLREVLHGDPLNSEGCLVFTDWGSDILEYLNTNGYPTKEIVRSEFYPGYKIPFIDNDDEYGRYLEFKNQSKLLNYFFYNSIVFVSNKRGKEVLEWTGERFLPYVAPEVSGIEIHYEHLHRYALAGRFVKGKKVLDLASGEGYGSYMLSNEAEMVIGLEIDDAAINHAKEEYVKDNLKYMKGSILDIPLRDDGIFDIVTCFEAIEHVTDNEKLVSEVKRMLKKDGIFIVSTPNKNFFIQDSGHNNPFHLKELFFEEFKELLERNFKNVHLLGQRVYSSSNIWSISDKRQLFDEEVIKWGNDRFYFSKGEAKTPVYFIAIASDMGLDEKLCLGSVLTDESNTILNKYNAIRCERDLLKQELRAIKEGLFGGVLTKSTCVFEKALPVGTARRNVYRLGRSGLIVLKNEGYISLLKRFKHYCFVSTNPVLRLFFFRAFYDEKNKDQVMQNQYANSVTRVIEVNPSRKRNLCILCHYDREKIIKDYVKYLVESLHVLDFDIVFVTSCNEIKDAELEKIKHLCHKIIVKKNVGYDFGSWVKAIEYVDLERYAQVMLINDSCYGPFYNLQPIIEAMNQRGLDMWGITDSFQGKYHIQSYFMVFNHNVINSPEFKKFCENFSVKTNKLVLIRKYEIGLSQMLIKKGYKIGVYCGYADVVNYLKEKMPEFYYKEIMHLEPVNPMHFFWDVIIERFNCPFVKRELLKVNPEKIDLDNWRSVLGKTGYDCSLIE